MRSILTTGLLAALLATQAVADVTISTATGDVTLTETPDTVAAFDIAAIDTLTALGITVTGVPNKLYAPYLDDVAQDATVVGTLFEPDFEALAVLGPDLIVVGSRSTDKAEALGRIAPVIDMTISGANLLDQTKSRINAFGAAFDRADEAAELTAQIDAKLAAASDIVTDKGTALIVLTNGPKISAFGAGSRFGWLHEEIGLKPVDETLEVSSHGQAISFEYIAETNPDWLLVVDRGAAIGQGNSAEATLDNPLVAGTTAAQKGQIVYLEPASIYVAGGGATSVLRTLDELITAFSGTDS